jgi:hypothetical protein
MRPNAKMVQERLMVLYYVVRHAMIHPHWEVFETLFPTMPEKDKNEIIDFLKKDVDESIASMKDYFVWDKATAAEISFLQSYGFEMDKQAHLNAMWRNESAGMLLWALNYIKEWPSLDNEINNQIFDNIKLKKNNFFKKIPKLRNRNEIDSKRDLIEFWHWRVRTRKLIEEGREFLKCEEFERLGYTSYDDIVRVSAKFGFEKGGLNEIIDEDFVIFGKPFRNLNNEEYIRATSIIMERHYALNWLCGYAPDNNWDETPTET